MLRKYRFEFSGDDCGPFLFAPWYHLSIVPTSMKWFQTFCQSHSRKRGFVHNSLSEFSVLLLCSWRTMKDDILFLFEQVLWLHHLLFTKRFRTVCFARNCRKLSQITAACIAIKTLRVLKSIVFRWDYSPGIWAMQVELIITLCQCAKCQWDCNQPLSSDELF